MVRLAFGPFRSRKGDIDSLFGKLEMRVLEALWQEGGPASVRDLQSRFPNTAYTTLMTTLDRLHRKNVLDRVKAGRAFLYRPRYTREELRVGLAGDALGAMLGSDLPARPILSFLVEAVSRQDAALLDELEQMIVERRRGRGAHGRRPDGEGQE